MKVKKIISLVLAVTLCILNLNTSIVNAAVADKSANNISRKVLYKADVITDQKLLAERAKKGIDDFKNHTGKEFKIAKEASKDLKVESYQTSQLINIVEDNGIKYEEYAITTVSYVTSFTDSKNLNGCTLQTTIYAQWDATGMALKFLFSQHSVTGSGRPTSLIMNNLVYLGWGSGQQYTNSQPVAQPGGSYTLASPYSGYIGDFSSTIQAGGILNFADGSSCSTLTWLDPK